MATIEELQKEMAALCEVYRQIDKNGVEQWLEDVPALTGSDSLAIIGGGPLSDEYATTKFNEAYVVGTQLQKIQEAMGIIKSVYGRCEKYYQEYKPVSMKYNCNPTIVKWIEDYEADHPNTDTLVKSELIKVCPMCGKEFKAKVKWRTYCSRSCVSKAKYHRNKRMEE